MLGIRGEQRRCVVNPSAAHRHAAPQVPSQVRLLFSSLGSGVAPFPRRKRALPCGLEARRHQPPLSLQKKDKIRQNNKGDWRRQNDPTGQLFFPSRSLHRIPLKLFRCGRCWSPRSRERVGGKTPVLPLATTSPPPQLPPEVARQPYRRALPPCHGRLRELGTMPPLSACCSHRCYFCR